MLYLRNRRQEQRLLGDAPRWNGKADRKRRVRAGRRRRRLPKKTRKSSSAPTAPSATSAKTSPTTCGSSACWDATSAIASSIAIPTVTTAGSQPIDGEQDHPHFGDVAEIYNVIDSRQSDAQNTVIEALRGLGYTEQADHYTHFSYEMVALTPRCAAELGYDAQRRRQSARPYIEVSGRKGFGVKADDLLDQLIASAKKEVDSRHPQLTEPERPQIATQIAIGALRYFMLKYTKQSVIAFDFKDALSFEGETGPYVQYAVVRAAISSAKQALIRMPPIPASHFLPPKSGPTCRPTMATKSGSCGWHHRKHRP